MTRLSDIGPAITRVLDQVRAEYTSAPAALPSARSLARLRAEIRERVETFCRSLRWHLSVPGTHPSGPANQSLLEYQERQGRDWEANTVQLKQAVLRALLERFLGGAAVPSVQQLRDAAGEQIVQHVVARVERGGWDVRLQPLTPEYKRAKARAGYGGRPIGVRTGAWLGALRQSRVVWE